MTLGAARWHVIADSHFSWEREALEWLRAHLPDRDPWHVWTNFEFIDDEGKVNEVDALVLSPAGLFLVEIKSRPGSLSGDAHSWTWTTDGRNFTHDNPLILANRKAKRLASLLKRQPAVARAKLRLPFVEPAIFLSSSSLACRLEGLGKSATFQHGRPGQMDDTGIVSALTNGIACSTSQRGGATVTAQHVKPISQGLHAAGIRPSNKHRQVGDYQLGKLLAEGPGFQDWAATHVSVGTVHRRVRIYTLATASSPEARAARARQARREFEILQGIDHPGILKAWEYKDTELGPALVFDHDPGAMRLDHLLRDHGARLTVTQRLHLVRSVAETLKYAHSKRLYHRALGPQSILVQGIESGNLHLRLMNWQTASRNVGNVGDSASPDTVHRTTGTRHVEDYVEDPGLVYLAPETLRADPAQGPSLDVFSLGCIAYHVFSGQPPAESVLELTEKLRVGQGLSLSDVMDGCGARQQELVHVATCPEVLARYDTMRGFLDELDGVEDELTTPDPEATVDPSVAGINDRLDGGFTVVRRMGKGSSSDALLVRADGSDEELILKVALDTAHNDRLVAEGEVLAKLHHHNIVAHRRTLNVAGRTALLLKTAGDKTLAETLKDVREQGRLSLDMLQRFGEELIEAVNHLEAEGVAHRDIKPDNIGITRNRSGKLQLVLFDFSLCRTPTDNITAGTHPYLDPFLALRKPPRWDLYAERFAAAVTLYEMAVGQPPVWGDGQTAPAMLDVEATIESDVFDPVTREGFTTFFDKALRRDYSQRYDNAEDMLRAWRAIFTAGQTLHPSATSSGTDAAITTHALTTMAELGYGLEAQVVLERMGIHNARELLAVDRIRFRYLRGVGDKIRKEIRLTAKELARLRPDLTQGRTSLHSGNNHASDASDGDEEAGGAVSVNELAAQLLPRRPAGDDRPEEAALAHYLGLDDAVSAWPSVGEAALAGELDRSVLTTALIKARERWLRNAAFTEVRNQLDVLLRSQGQVMSATEAALALLALRGCAEQDEGERLRQASAVLRAAVEAESHLDQPRFEAFDHAPVTLIATAPAWADYARQLGTAADVSALADPLLPPTRVLEALEGVAAPTAASATVGTGAAVLAPLTPTRLLRLATSASRHAALSSRQEIYPRNMPALQALRQSINALVGATLSPAALQARVRGRYPEARPLPGRPALDHLLEEAGAPLRWEPTAAEGAGAYCSATLGSSDTAGLTTHFARQRTRLSHDPEPASSDAQARAAEERLQRSLRQGGLLVITVDPRLARRAQTELLHRFSAPDATSPGRPGLQCLNFDALLLGALRAQADLARIDWNVVLSADAADRSSRDWTNLMRLVQRTLPVMRRALLHSAAPLLWVSAGLLARYELMTLVTEIEAAAGRPGHTPSVWLLLPTTHQGLPVIDGVALPLVNNIDNTQALTLPQGWIENKALRGGPG